MENKDYIEQHQAIRKQLWVNVYVSYVGAANATNPDGASKWADIALVRFDERFSAYVPSYEGNNFFNPNNQQS